MVIGNRKVIDWGRISQKMTRMAVEMKKPERLPSI